MTKKKAEKQDTSLRLKTRQPGKVNKNYFGDFKSRFEETLHPLDEMFPPDTQRKSSDAPKAESSGHPAKKISDTQAEKIKHPTDLTPDTQPNNTGHPAAKTLSALTPETKFDAPRTGTESSVQAPSQKYSGHPKNANWRDHDKVRSSVRVNLHIDREIDKKVRQYCLVDANPKIELKQFYERAAIELLRTLDTQPEGKSGAQTPLDDRRMMLMSKSSASLINLYLAYNQFFNQKTKWTVRDDEAGFKFNDVDLRIIELAFIQTHFNKGFRGKINSFQYYVGQIEEMMQFEYGEEVLETMLKINRSRWQQSTKKEIDLSFLEK